MSDEDLKVDSSDVASDRGTDRSERSTERADRGEARELSGTPSAPERTPEGRFPKGTSGNPAGRPRGARGRFSAELVNDFADDWQKHGPGVIAKVRQEDPVSYLNVAVRLVPKEFLIDTGGGDVLQMSDEDLIAVVIAKKTTRE
jgi:hypothetical protein